MGGADAGNYTLASSVGSTLADIARAPITAIHAPALSRTYDGSATAATDLSGAVLVGKVGGDDLLISASAASFADKRVGADRTVTLQGLSLSGADAGNYTLATGTTTATITPAVIAEVAGITAADKVYDGAVTATLRTGSAQFLGAVPGDELVVATATGVFADKNAGPGKPVSISSITLGGADAGNYSLSRTTASTTAAITPRPLQVELQGTISKPFDGTVNAALSGTNFAVSNVVAGEAIAILPVLGAYDNPQVGTGKTVSVSLAVPDFAVGPGTSISNYLLPGTALSMSQGEIQPNPPPVSVQSVTQLPTVSVAASPLPAPSALSILPQAALELGAGASLQPATAPAAAQSAALSSPAALTNQAMNNASWIGRSTTLVNENARARKMARQANTCAMPGSRMWFCWFCIDTS